MMEKIKISFIVPVYNAEKYIERCVESILRQKYKNFEVILVDDGSKDNSYKLISQYSTEYNNVISVTQKNAGPSKARNKGLELATGDYIAFVDSDDYLKDCFLAEMIDKSYDGKSDLVVCNYTEINTLGILDISIFNDLKDNLIRGNDLCLKEVLKGPGGLVWGKFFKREIIIRNNLSFDVTHHMCEDLLFCIEYIKMASFVSRSKEYIYMYNKCNDESITAKYSLDMFYKQIEIQENIRESLEKDNLYTSENRQLLSDRFKGILSYSIEKEYNEVFNKSLKEKMESIDKVLSSVAIQNYLQEIHGEGPLDKQIVKSMKEKRIGRLYILVRIRLVVVYLYSKIFLIRKGKLSSATQN